MKIQSKFLRGAILLACVLHISSIFLINVITYQDFEQVKKTLPVHSDKILDEVDKLSASIPQSVKMGIGIYSAYSGITGYCFFSPDPPFPYQIIVERTDENGGQAVNTLTLETQEGYNRLVTAASFIRDIKNDTLKDIVMRSVAARTYEKFPDTKQLRIITAYYILPPPKSFSNGNKQFFEQHSLYSFKKL